MIGNLLTQITAAGVFLLGAVVLQRILNGRVRVPVRASSHRTAAPVDGEMR